MVFATSGSNPNSLYDWLVVHSISGEDVARVLSKRSRLKVSYSESILSKVGTSPDGAWLLATKALAWKFPLHADYIHEAAAKIEVEFSKKNDGIARPFVLDRGANSYPYVSLPYAGTVSDLLSFAHELGHAVQLISAQGVFISPIMREIAAFLSELALLGYAEIKRPDLFESLRHEHSVEDRIYLGNDVQRLMFVFKDPNCKYEYRWNYPMARVLAAQIFRILPSENLWDVFSGEMNLPQLIRYDSQEKLMNKLENYLPSAPPPEQNHTMLNTYRSLGMMALLDIDYWQGPSEKTISDYYTTTIDHINDGSAFIAFSDDKKPIGYATWKYEQSDPGRINLTRQTAPFGDHLTLQKKVKSCFPYLAHVESLHDRSARKVQTAW